jgi:hypothetical protein
MKPYGPIWIGRKDPLSDVLITVPYVDIFESLATFTFERPVDSLPESPTLLVK